jgi:hypothetical protein
MNKTSDGAERGLTTEKRRLIIIVLGASWLMKRLDVVFCFMYKDIDNLYQSGEELLINLIRLYNTSYIIYHCFDLDRAGLFCIMTHTKKEVKHRFASSYALFQKFNAPSLFLH